MPPIFLHSLRRMVRKRVFSIPLSSVTALSKLNLKKLDYLIELVNYNTHAFLQTMHSAHHSELSREKRTSLSYISFNRLLISDRIHP